MARRRGGGNRFRVDLEGMSEAALIPGWLEHAQRRFVGRLTEGLVDEIGRHAPGGPGGEIARSFEGRALTSDLGEITSRHPGAKALEKGAYITPKGLSKLPIRKLVRQKRRLKFRVDGRTVYRPYVRLAPRGYVRRAFRRRNRIGREAFKDTFDDLRRTNAGP